MPDITPTRRIALLGGFSLLCGGEHVTPGPGRPADALKLVAARGGRMTADAVIEALWPDSEPGRGRQRLRTVLARLRREIGDVLVRDGESVRVHGAVRADVAEFRAHAHEALTGTGTQAGAAAVAAVRLYVGPLLPDDPYAPWLDEPRRQLAWRHLALLDLLASTAQDAGQLDHALRWLRLAIEADPHSEDRYVRAARLLARRGRRVRGLELLDRARTQLHELGLPASPPLRNLRRELAAA